MKNACPCQSKHNYNVCCRPFHLGKLHPATAEALMRSRYSAYVLNKSNYIYRSWHSETRPSLQELRLIPAVQYINLTILECQQGQEQDEYGTVSFVATYLDNNKPKELQELSSFKRENKRWVYVKGQ